MMGEAQGPQSIDSKLIDPVLEMARMYHQEIGYETVSDVVGGLAVFATAELLISTKEIHLPLPCLSAGRHPFDVSFRVNIPLSSEDHKDWKLEVLYCGKDRTGNDLSSRYHMLVTGDNKILTTVNTQSPRGYLNQESMPVLAGIIQQIYTKAKQLRPKESSTMPRQRQTGLAEMLAQHVSGARHSA